MAVRAKFAVQAITTYADGGKAVSLLPVMPDNAIPENASFWKATPSGRIEMHITNPDAAVQFEAGAYYYVDFTPVE